MKYSFTQNQKVRFSFDSKIVHEGIIVGCSTRDNPIVGFVYIVEVTDKSIPTKEYPFTTCAVPECLLIVN